MVKKNSRSRLKNQILPLAFKYIITGWPSSKTNQVYTRKAVQVKTKDR